MAHDLLAELAGYRDELAGEERRGRAGRAACVRAEIDRVRTQIAVRAEILEQEAEDHIEAGQDVKAAQAAVAARNLRQALAELADALQGQAPAEDPQDPQEPQDPGPEKETPAAAAADPAQPDPQPEPQHAGAGEPAATTRRSATRRKA